jgi:hypothetical protein
MMHDYSYSNVLELKLGRCKREARVQGVALLSMSSMQDAPRP